MTIEKKKNQFYDPPDIIRNITAKAMSWLVTSLFPDCVQKFCQLECKQKESTNHIQALLL